MKYQSEIIKEIVDTRGHEKSSPHYESECLETWIEENKGAYPKLTDYQAEWLNYISILDDTGGEFPYETITDVTNVTVDNVVPLAYQSAILKGQTLVNLCELSEMNKPNSSREDVVDIPLHHLKENTQYTVIVNLLESSDTSIVVGFLNPSGSSWKGVVRNISISSDMKMLITTETGVGNKLRIHNNSSKGTLTVKNAVVLEGDYTNQDIPFFEGMKSVKMPVLTTSNEDGSKTNILTVNEPVELGGIGDVQDELDLKTGELVQHTGKFMVDGTEEFGWTGAKGETLFEINIRKSSIVEKLNNEVDDRRPSLCSTLKYEGTTMYGKAGTGFAITGGSDYSFLQIVIQKEKLSDTSLDGVKQYLSKNPLYFVVPLLNKSIKTVDLTVVNQDGENVSLKPIEGTMHLTTSSETIKPLFSGEIPVEAITQNLASFINLEMEVNNE